MKNLAIWNITAQCGNRCVACGLRSAYPDGQSLGTQAVGQIAQMVADQGFSEVIFAGGEPLGSPELSRALEVLGGKVRLAAFTGGAISDPARVGDQIQAGLERIVFSLDSGEEALNDRLRGRSGATRDLLELAEGIQRRFPKVIRAFHTVVGSANAQGLENTLERIAGLEPHSWSLTLMGDNFRFKLQDQAIPAEQLKRFYSRIVPDLARRAGEQGIQLRVQPTPLPWLLAGAGPGDWGARNLADLPGVAQEYARFAKGRYNQAFVQAHGCPLAGLDVSIGPAGEVYPCSQAAIYRPAYRVGRVPDQSLQAVLRSEAMAAFKRSIPRQACQRCYAPSNLPAAFLKRLVR